MLTPDTRHLLHDMPAPAVKISASPARRVLALSAVYALGGLLVWAALQGDGGAVRMLLLVLLGVGFLVAAERMRRATTLEIVLDAEGLRDSAGTVLVAWDDIEKIDRGAFSNKPSNGFSVLLKDRQPAGWAPGMWWRVGRRVGIGGVLPARPTRFMGEQMALWHAARSLPSDTSDT